MAVTPGVASCLAKSNRVVCTLGAAYRLDQDTPATEDTEKTVVFHYSKEKQRIRHLGCGLEDRLAKCYNVTLQGHIFTTP
jgi:hypothetical protein